MTKKIIIVLTILYINSHSLQAQNNFFYETTRKASNDHDWTFEIQNNDTHPVWVYILDTFTYPESYFMDTVKINKLSFFRANPDIVNNMYTIFLWNRNYSLEYRVNSTNKKAFLIWDGKNLIPNNKNSHTSSGLLINNNVITDDNIEGVIAKNVFLPQEEE